MENNPLLNDQWVIKKIREEILKIPSFTSAEECATNISLINKHTGWEVHSGFYP
jgi:hypothetical protein